MRIKAILLEMASNEILKMIPASEYMRIHQVDSKPLFRAYVVGHEGESKGKVAADGVNFVSVVKKWYRSAIEKLHEKINLGLKLFHGHEMTNDVEGRTPIGEVVGKALKTISGVLSEIIVAYIKPEFKNLPLDVASIEADIELTDNGGVYEANVRDMKAIALGSSVTETPGFPGAMLLGYCQEFADKSQIRSNEMAITISEVKDFIKTEKVKPTDLFDLEAISEDSMISDHIGELIRKAKQGEYEHRRRTDDKFDREKREWEKRQKEFDTIKEENLKLKKNLAKTKVVTLLDKIIQERKFDEEKDAPQIKFLKKKASEFEPEDVDQVEKELDKFVDSKIDEFKEISKDIFGIENDKEKTGDGDGDGDGSRKESDGDLTSLKDAIGA